LRELRDAWHEDDTLVIYLSDNGRPFPGAKDNLDEPGLHLPLIIRSPEQRKLGVRNGALVSWIDVAPSILDWARISTPRDYRYAPLPGRSLLPILEQTDAAGFDRIFATHSFHEINQYYPMRSMRTRRYSYFLNLEPSVAVPVASDVQLSPSWKAILNTPAAKLGKRTLETFTHRSIRRTLRSHGRPGGGGQPCAGRKPTRHSWRICGIRCKRGAWPLMTPGCRALRTLLGMRIKTK
jgi:N-sulfoglucosamine sulfohydrolase